MGQLTIKKNDFKCFVDTNFNLLFGIFLIPFIACKSDEKDSGVNEPEIGGYS